MSLYKHSASHSISSSTNPGWDPSMPSWNLTTECREWDEDFHPCTFPYFGLSGYSPDAFHCDTKFSEAFPDAYMTVHTLFLVSNCILALLYGSRVLYCLVDTEFLPVEFINALLRDPKFKRDPKPNRKKAGVSEVQMNVYDFCNCFMLATCLLQVVLSCDVEAWDDLIPYKAHVIMGIVSQNVAVMTGIPITVNWMNLIHVWSDPFKNRNTRPRLGVIMRNSALATMWFVAVPMQITALFVTDSCSEGCENGTLSCFGKVVFSVVLITIVLTSSHYAFRIYLVLKSDDKFNLIEFLFPFCTKRGDRDDKEILSSGAGSTDDDLRQKVIWDQIRKIWKIVFVSVLVSILVIQDNFSYCFGHYGTIKYEDPPCSASDTVLGLKMMWFMLLGSVVFLLLIPRRQEKQSAAVTRVLVERINSNTEHVAPVSKKGGEVALSSSSTA